MVVAEHDAQLRIRQVSRRVVLAVSVHIGHGIARLGHTVSTRLIDVTTKAVAETPQEVRDVLGLDATGGRDQNRLGAVLVEHALVLVCNQVNRLFPADALELAASALARTLHRVLETIWMVDPTTHGATALTGANLMVAELVVSRIVGLHANDLVIFRHNAQGAATIAVRRAMCPGYLLF